MRRSAAFDCTTVAFIAAAAMVACNKKGGSSNPAETPPVPASTATGGTTATGGATGATAGTVALTAGAIAFNVQPVSSGKGFAQLNDALASASAKTTPGSLAISPALALSDRGGRSGLGLAGTSTATNSAGAPVSFSYSIASGAPDSFQISLTKVELSVASQAPSVPPNIEVTPAGQAAPTSGVAPTPTSSSTCASGVTAAAGGATTAAATGTATGAVAAGSGTGTAIAATTQPGGSASLVLFNNPAGTPLSVVSGTLDLGALAGTCGTFPVVPSGNAYNQIKLTFLREAKISGCVTSTFINPGNVAPIITGPHTYCTQAGNSTFDATAPTNATFESTVANPLTGELMGIDLAFGSNPNSTATPSATDTVSLSFPISPALTIAKAGQQVPLSIVIDLNRMLRYYNGNLNNVTGRPAGQTYFFTSIFNQSIYAFVGTPGHIYGYDIVYENCDVDNKGPYVPNANAALAMCGGGNGIGSAQVIQNAFVGTGQDPWGSVGGWMTVVTDSKGAPLVVNLMSNDDNDLVILKGSIHGIAVPFAPGSAAGTTNISYGQGNSVQTGTLQGFPTDLGIAASAAANPGATSPVVGTEITGVTFDAHTAAPVGSATQGSHNQGPVYIQVGLSD